jgi:sugar lactone lactonase YvrE
MGARELTTVVDQMTFTECPRWRDGRLYFSDFYTYRVMSVVPGRDAEEIVSVPQQPSGLGWLPDGRMLVVSMRDRKILRQEQSGELVEHADLSGVTGGHVNDMVVAPSGIAYAGNFGFDLMAGDPIKPTPLVRIDPDGTVAIASEPLMFPNGSAITADGKTLVISESIGNRMSAFDVAADGAVWVADSAGDRVIRLAEGGEILDEIATGEGCYACMLGGDDGRTLFMCVAPDFHEDARKAAREARIVATQVDVGHAGTP